MSVAQDGDIIRLAGQCGVEDAEALLGLMAGCGTCRVDLSAASHLHAAVVQVLCAFPQAIDPAAAPPADPFLAAWVFPMLQGYAARDRRQGPQ